MINRRFLVGYSGHSYPIIEALQSSHHKFDGYFELSKKENNPYNLFFLGSENKFLFKNVDVVFVAIGDNILRKKISERLQKVVNFFSIVDNKAIVRSKINQNGIIINAGAIVQPQCSIGDGVIINTKAIIEHECIIGNYVHIAPGATIAGNVIIGENSLIGLNAAVLPGVKIGKNCVIGAGSVVTKDVCDNSILKGNPAK